MRFAIYGAGGFGREVAPVARAMLAAAGRDAEVVFVSDFAEPVTNGYALLTPQDLAPDDEVVIAVGDPAARRKLAAKCEALGLGFAHIVAPQHVGYDANSVGGGAILCAGSIITSNATIGRHFHANLNAYVAHDCVVGDFVTLSPNVACNGRVTIEDDVFIGAGALLKPGVRIGRGAVIGMGAVVVRDVPAGATVVGNPARVVTAGAQGQ